jgi:alkylation response protein AidB-like acyl-CoA dehydrogenase
MQIDLGPRLDAIKGKAREVATSVTSKHAAEHDRTYSMPVETLAALKDIGLLTISAPKRLGGDETGMVNLENPLGFLLVVEELARVDMSAAHCFQVHAHQPAS